MMNFDADVAIVGGGPVGLGLAIDLAQRGVTSYVIERSIELHGIPARSHMITVMLEWLPMDICWASTATTGSNDQPSTSSIRLRMSAYHNMKWSVFCAPV